MNGRIKILRNELEDRDIQGMIVSNPKNIRYLTGLLSEGTLIINKKENIFLTDSRYIEEVEKQISVDDNISIINISDISRYDYENFFILCNNVGFEEKFITYETYQNYLQLYQVNLVETEGIIEKIREIKEEEEIQNIKRACKITDECFDYIVKYIKKGMTEKRIAFEIEKYMRMNGADEIAFDFCVASGENSSMPHATPTDRKIKENDVLLLDIGCKVNGYCSDFTRTIYIGKAPEIFKDEYNFVLEEQKKIIENLKPDKDIKQIIELIYKDYADKNYLILHAFGHGLGLYIHENPILGNKKENYLKENMVIAVEPGIYKKNEYGIRIEDTILITKNGSINLTESAKNLIEVQI
ncbi:MAG: M24 family metallopeptidase [Candidatus Scatovivens sp.]